MTPQDPDFQSPSDRVTEFETDGFGPEAVEKFGMGDYIAEIIAGREEPAVNLTYDMQRWFRTTTGAPNSLEAYGVMRVAGLPVGSLTVVERLRSGDVFQSAYVRPESTVEYNYNDAATVDDTTEKESRIYTVTKGCHVGDLTLNGDPDEETWSVETTLPAEFGRSVQIDQPTAETTVAVHSTDARDSGLHVVIESDDGTTSEAVQIGADAGDGSGTAPTASTATFATIDAIQVEQDDGSDSPTGETADHFGEIVVSVNEGADATTVTPGDALCVLYGSDTYGNTFGDPGVPPVGAGSHSSDVGQDYFRWGNTAVERPPGTPFEEAGEVQSAEISLGNDNERVPQERSRQSLTLMGTQEIEATIGYASETGSHRNLKQRMTMEEADLELFFTRDRAYSLALPRSVISESGRTRSAGEVNADQEATLRGQEPPEISTPPQ